MPRVFALLQSAVLLLALAGWSRGEQIIAVPPGPGNAGTFYPLLIVKEGFRSMRYQQVYAADAFAALAPTSVYLTQIDFWLHPWSSPQGASYPTDLQMRLSTTAKGPDALSLNFAENIGPDEILVFQVSGQEIFMEKGQPIAFIFPKPFLYTPAQGNLLLDVRIGVSSYVDPNDYELLANDSPTDSVSRVYAMAASATQATASDTVGLNTTFHFNPVPSLQSEFHRVYAGTLSNDQADRQS